MLSKSKHEKLLAKSLKRLETRVRTVELDFSSLVQIACDLYEDFNTPTSLGLYLCCQYKDFKSIVEHSIDPRQYDNVDEFRLSYQAVSFLKKIDFDIDGLDPVAKALESFHESERMCLETNRNFELVRSGQTSVFPARVHSILHGMARDIAAILGGFDSNTWMLSCQFGPGAVVGAPGSSAYDKLGAAPCVTAEFAKLGAALVNTSPAWLSAISNSSISFSEDDFSVKQIDASDLVIAKGGSYSQVPKSAKTKRNIEKQPSLNAYAQSGLGKMIRQKLKKAGLDLRTQQTRNRAAAGAGSKRGHLATVDLSSASDTIAYKLVEELIPQRWFYALDICRTRFIESVPNRDDKQPLERFSSMGNGYTFELETLIFWALVRACRREVNCQEEYHVFGDDIICSVKVATLLLEVIPFLGFNVNSEKTFVSSVFKESCGQDYFKGINVRPYFYKKGVNNSDLQAIISLANGLRRAAWRASNHYGCVALWRRAWVRCLRGIPSDIRALLIGPWSDEDRWIISDDEDVLRNPGLFRDQFTWSWKMPSLSKRSIEKTVSSFHSARAAMLYKIDRSSLSWQGDELLLNHDRSCGESSFFAVPREHSEQQCLDVTYVEFQPVFATWVKPE